MLDRLNLRNIEEYQEHGPAGKGRYVCTMCKGKTDADNSYSNLGENLICHGCMLKHFGDPMAAFAQYITPEQEEWRD